ncbi:MAG TPA: PIN domain-containing protein, partial [Chthoniobacterales bacterium]|nr:PIN domain-containing protein [Chthoniobacterales bacterium]
MLMLDVMNEVPTDNNLWRSAAELAWKLDRRGVVLPVSNLVIAACALQVDVPLLTLDLDFSRIPGLKTRRTIS